MIANALFADGILIFELASRSKTLRIMDIIKTYSAATGQQLNFIKSSIFFSKMTPLLLKHDILSILNMREMKDGDKYLDLPALKGRSKVKALEFIKDKVSMKTQACKQKLLLLKLRRFTICYWFIFVTSSNP